jgi:hypothetical protein
MRAVADILSNPDAPVRQIDLGRRGIAPASLFQTDLA